jgi:glutathione S-transferase
LFPGDARQRALVRRMVCEADQYVNAAMSKLAGSVLFVQPDEWDQTAIVTGRDGLLKELAAWEHSLSGDSVAGPLSAADFALYPMLAIAMRCEIKKPDLGLKAALPAKVAAWMSRVEALPYFKKTWPPHWK